MQSTYIQHAIEGVEIPTLFVDYHPANDMFFSGHTGTTLLIALELYQLDYQRLAMVQVASIHSFLVYDTNGLTKSFL